MPYFTVESPADNIRRSVAAVGLLARTVDVTLITCRGGFPVGGSRFCATEPSRHRKTTESADQAWPLGTLESGASSSNAGSPALQG
jgi:5-carboxymethyl-2-hydroxymuconate isomerase